MDLSSGEKDVLGSADIDVAAKIVSTSFQN